MNFLSHYSVLVLSDEDTEVDGLLAPFNENISVKPYIKYTKEELIAREKEEIKVNDCLDRIKQAYGYEEYKTECIMSNGEAIYKKVC